MYDWLLFFHVLAAFMLVSTVVTYSAVVLGVPAGPRAISVANVFWDVGGLATLVLGIWLALDVDTYEVWDGWILGAIVAWVVAAGLGQQVRRATEEGGAAAGRVATLHWLRSATVLVLLILMIWKPGA